ncbi:hypothetical protein L7F22_028031 [Adiantum nelumboides]|nr:hypothetical protein [Adiantum nelumboides]
MQDVGTDCDVPLACGPLGVCAAREETVCSCPDYTNFQPRNSADYKQGCKYELPACSSGASNSPSIECLHNCSCYGITYQYSSSSCFQLISHSISFIKVGDYNVTLSNYTITTPGYSSSVFRKRIYADDYVTCLKVAASSSGKSSNDVPFPIMTLIGIKPSSLLACLFLGLGANHLRKRRRARLQQAREDEELRDIFPLLPARFSYKELRVATKGFCKLLGAGGCRSVYAGTLSDGRKVLEGVLQGALQSRDFLAEVATVGRTGHHNIVRLVGFCWQVSHRILVYAYLERGSLDRWLFGREEDTLLDWQKRYNIALGVARGLHYLHENCEQAILHFDIKPQNILLDPAFVAKISDFGMSKLMQRDVSCAVTMVRGTPGYIAPEWLFHGIASKKNDIYSFGMVMLEIVAGRKLLEPALRFDTGDESSNSQYNISSTVSGQEDGAGANALRWHLPSWASQKLEEGALLDVVDECSFD